MGTEVHIPGSAADLSRVQAVATRPPDAAVTDGTSSGRLIRLWHRSLGWHALALTLLLLTSLLLTVPDQLGHADEGAALSQTQLLLDGDGWSMTHPLPDADPAGRAFPIGGSARQSGTDEYVPFPKHPVYPVLLLPFVGLFGVAGGAVLSIIGTVLAALSAALLARRLDPDLARPAFWFLGVATPLWFDSFITIAHPLGAAAVGFSALLLLAPRSRVPHVLGGALLLTFGVMLRNETTLLAVAFAVALGASSFVRRDRRQLAVAAAAFGAAMLGFLFDAQLASMVLGGDPVEPFTIRSTGSLVGDRFGAFMYTVLAPSDGTAIGLVLSALGTVLVVAAAIIVRRRPHDGSGILVFLGSALAVEIVRWFVESDAHVPGLVFAAPVLVGGLLLLDRATIAQREVSLLLGTSALFFGAVVATQYANGGGGGWGGRYFAIALPLVVPVAAMAMKRAGESIAVSVRRPAVALVAGVAIVLSISSSTSLLVDHRITDRLESTVAASTAGLDAGDGDARPVVVSTALGVGRIAFREVLGQRWLEVPADDEDVVPYVERLHALGVQRFVLVTREPGRIVADVASLYEVTGRSDIVIEDAIGSRVESASKVLVLEAVNLS